METYTAFIVLSTGSRHKITEETYNQIKEANLDDLITLPNGTAFKNSAVMEIGSIDDWVDREDIDYHQPYTKLPAGIGFTGIISNIRHLKDLEAFARGLKKAKTKIEAQGRTTKNIDEFLRIARLRYLKIQHEV